MTFWYVFGTDLIFFELFPFYLYLGLITTPMFSMSHDLCLFLSHNFMAKRSHYRIMIFFDFGVLLYGHIPTLTFYFLHYSTTPALPIDVD